MRRQLTEAARECLSTTLTDAAGQFEFIQKLAASIAGQFDRVHRVKVVGNDVVVTYLRRPGPQAARRKRNSGTCSRRT